MVFRVADDVRDIKTFKWLVDGASLRYVGNRSDHEFRFPPQHEFEWVRAHARHARRRDVSPHQHRRPAVRRDDRGRPDRQDREQHRDGRGHLRGAGRQPRPNAGRRRFLLRDRGQPGAAEDSAVPGGEVPVPRLQRQDAGKCAAWTRSNRPAFSCPTTTG